MKASMFMTKTRYVLLTLFVGIFLFILPLVARSGVWHDNYALRKAVFVQNPNGSVLTNYQVQLRLHQIDGVDSGSDIYLGGHILANFNDIRFTTDDGTTLLDYWIESTSGSTATVWVEASLLQASSTTKIYLYYDNPSASSASNPEAVFPFYDDFDVTGISDWTGSEAQVNHAEETGNQHQSVSTSSYVTSPNSAQLQTYASCFSGPFDGVQSLLTTSPNLSSGNYRIDFKLKLQVTGFRYSTSGVQRSRVKVNGNEEFYDEISCNGLNCMVEGDWTSEYIDLTSTALTTLAIYGDSYDCANGNTFYDTIRVRNHVSNEPTVLSASQAESQSGNAQISTPLTQDVSCDVSIPEGIPDLFQIDTTSTGATLYFTPLTDTDIFYISYSTQSGAEEHGAEATLGRDGVQRYDVGALSPGTMYYFKVRGQRGCMPGGWSNIRSARTSGGESAHTQKSVLGMTKNAIGRSESTKQTPQPTRRPVSQKLVKSKMVKPSITHIPAKVGILSRMSGYVRKLVK